MNKVLGIGIVSFTLLTIGILISLRPKQLLRRVPLSMMYMLHGMFSVLGVIAFNLYIVNRTSSSLLEMLRQGIVVLFIATVISGLFGLTSLLFKYNEVIIQRLDQPMSVAPNQFLFLKVIQPRISGEVIRFR